MSLFRIAAIDFLNPAPLMWNFEHPPEAGCLAQRYTIEKMTPAECAARLGAGAAELGLIPIAALAALPGLAIVPGCAIASLGPIRSILLVLRALAGFSPGEEASAVPDSLCPPVLQALQGVRSVALDTASRASAMYTQILFRKYWQREPRFVPHRAELDAMLAQADAALVIGDPALHALEDRAARERRTGERLVYLDLGHAWRKATRQPWVSAVWAARPAGLGDTATKREDQARLLVADLQASRDAGLAHIPELAEEWSPRLDLPRATIETYLGRNIHYRLDPACLAGMHRFFADAAECGLINEPPALTFL